MDAKELLVLARDEIEDLQKQRKRPDRYNFLTLFDIEDDRRVTLEEYAFLHGPERQFREFDTDSDGVVTYEEIIDYRTERERRRDADAANRPRSVWDIHDADKDGRVSVEEFGGGEAVFRRLDKNRDGYLTPADA
jgi:Ca2+-binding EF-hand superfamily protein